MTRALLGLGANIGNPCRQLLDAAEAIKRSPGIKLLALSPMYRSAPMGPPDQPDFVNACALLDTKLDAHGLLKRLQSIETTMGRVKHRHWGERVIDLDLLLFEDQLITSSDLRVPHPGLTSRDFVLRPLIDLLGPSFTLPDGSTLAAHLQTAANHRLERLENTPHTAGYKS